MPANPMETIAMKRDGRPEETTCGGEGVNEQAPLTDADMYAMVAN